MSFFQGEHFGVVSVITLLASLLLLGTAWLNGRALKAFKVAS